MENIQEFITTYQIGDIASIFGLLVAVIGFSATIYNVVKSKSAAIRAEQAADKAVASVQIFQAVSDISKVISILDEIKRLNRVKEWKVLLDRYSTLRSLIVEIKAANPDLSEGKKIQLQSAIQHAANLENKIETATAKGEEPDGIPQMNKIISNVVETLSTLLVEIKIANDR